MPVDWTPIVAVLITITASSQAYQLKMMLENRTRIIKLEQQ